MPSRTSPRRERASYRPSWEIASDEVEQGCILWLGEKETTDTSYRKRTGSDGTPVVDVLTNLPANDGMFGHPIVVISRPASDPFMIQFHPMTSFGGQTLAERFRGNKAGYFQSSFVPVTPAPQHPGATNHREGLYRTLTLENGDRLEKSSYVNARQVYKMDWRDAELYWGSNPFLRKTWKLDRPSITSLGHLTALMARVNPTAQFIPTGLVSAQARRSTIGDLPAPSRPLPSTAGPSRESISIHARAASTPLFTREGESVAPSKVSNTPEERQPLLPTHQNQSSATKDDNKDRSWCGWILYCMWRTVLRGFSGLVLRIRLS